MVNESGILVAGDAKTTLGLKELSTVVVQGTAESDGAGNLSVAATKVFLRDE